MLGNSVLAFVPILQRQKFHCKSWFQRFQSSWLTSLLWAMGKEKEGGGGERGRGETGGRGSRRKKEEEEKEEEEEYDDEAARVP